MCGIVGYLGKGDAYPALIKGLKRLEYRGYDSAGVALIGNDWYHGLSGAGDASFPSACQLYSW